MVYDLRARVARHCLLAVIAAGMAGSVFAQQDGSEQTAGEGENPVQMVLRREVPQQYTPGSTITVTVTIDAPLTGDITAMGLTEFIPEGWTFNGPGQLVRGVLPSVTPPPGAQDQLDFAWIVIPQNEFPFVFNYLVDVPAGASGPQTISGFVEYRMQGPAHFSNEAISQMDGFDKQPPVITLNGDSTITITVGDAFSDPGATATDNVDANVTVNAEGNVNAAVAGTYTITYTARDAAGNRATPVTRTVIVKEAAPNNNNGGTGGGTSNPRYRGGGGIYMPDEDLVGRTTTPEEGTATGGAAQPAPNAAGAVQGAGFPNAGNQNAFQPQSALPTRSVTPIPAGERPPITPTSPIAPGTGTNREFGKPRLTREGDKAPEPATNTAGETTIAPPTATTDMAPVATEVPTPTEIDPLLVAQATPAETPIAPAVAPEPAEAERPGFLGGIAAAFGALSMEERLGLGVVLGIMIVIAVLGIVAYKFAYKPGPRRRTRS
jgi:hypothetical protein